MATPKHTEVTGRRRTLVVGRSGELAVMAELLLRGWTPARPEIDVGDDALIIDDLVGTFWRLQVKTATAATWNGGSGYKAQFGLRIDQLRAAPTPDLYYVFAVRDGARWTDFVVVPRDDLRREYQLHGVGSSYDGRLTINLYFDREGPGGGTISAGTSHGEPPRDWTRFRDRWPPVATMREAA